MILLSLFDYSGEWSKPYTKDNLVIRIDPKLGGAYSQRGVFTESKIYGDAICNDKETVLPWTIQYLVENLPALGRIDAILAAPPCTDFATSGSKHFKAKDADGRTAESLEIVTCLKKVIDYYKPIWYAIEQPNTRMHKMNPWMGKPKLRFDPWDYAGWADDPSKEAYDKETWIFGNFNNKLIRNPVKSEGNGKITQLGGNSAKTKELRSITPSGFARAFYEANK